MKKFLYSKPMNSFDLSVKYCLDLTKKIVLLKKQYFLNLLNFELKLFIFESLAKTCKNQTQIAPK